MTPSVISNEIKLSENSINQKIVASTTLLSGLGSYYVTCLSNWKHNICVSQLKEIAQRTDLLACCFQCIVLGLIND